MRHDFSFLPWAETQARKAEALKMYRDFFGEEVPPSKDEDARYMAATCSLFAEHKSSPEVVLRFEELLKTSLKEQNAD